MCVICYQICEACDEHQAERLTRAAARLVAVSIDDFEPEKKNREGQKCLHEACIRGLPERERARPPYRLRGEGELCPRYVHHLEFPGNRVMH